MCGVCVWGVLSEVRVSPHWVRMVENRVWALVLVTVGIS